jgi:hypothetical protein
LFINSTPIAGTLYALSPSLALAPGNYLTLGRITAMKKLATVALISMFAAFALPVFAADPPATPEDCKKAFEGDDVKIKACIAELKK